MSHGCIFGLNCQRQFNLGKNIRYKHAAVQTRPMRHTSLAGKKLYISLGIGSQPFLLTHPTGSQGKGNILVRRHVSLHRLD